MRQLLRSLLSQLLLRLSVPLSCALPQASSDQQAGLLIRRCSVHLTPEQKLSVYVSSTRLKSQQLNSVRSDCCPEECEEK